MKRFLILCVVLVDRIQGEFLKGDPFTTEYDQIVGVCRNKTGYTDDVFEKEVKSYFYESRGLRKFNYCFLEKTGFITSDGKLNIDNALAKLKPGLLKDKVEQCKNHEGYRMKKIFPTCFHSVVKFDMQVDLLRKDVKDEINKNFTQIVEVCRKETGYTDEVIAEDEKNDSNAGLKKFNECFLKKSGFSDYDKFDIDKYLAKMSMNAKSNVTEMIELCQLKTSEKIIPDGIPYFSACLHVEVSDYIRATESEVLVAETDDVIDLVDDCREEVGFTYNVFEKRFTDDNFTEDTTILRKFNDCFLEKTGFITSDGKLNIDAALEKLPPSFVRPIVEHCQANIILKYTADNVHDFSVCYLEGIQSHISEALRDGYLALEHSLNVFVPGTYLIDKILTF